MSVKILTTRDITNLIMGRELTTGEVIELAFKCFPDYQISKRAIGNRLINLSKSRNAEMRIIKNGKVNTWALISVSEAYFRKSSTTRGGVITKEKPRRPFVYTRTRLTSNDIHVMEFQRVYQIADRLLRAAQTRFINQYLNGEANG
ncbi:hypothetical protein [Yersinia massiliensis]|uniref:hypothetical protein n=1 Tax=Yersinia massiliensis TaxID=419257 RepID=UPI001CFCD10D|nr:hypothetical protein [Yersinia massiliensis]MCB5308312.1 hypothetical protein [Yersinia massiliensis]